jgi:hypothetical protein
MPLKTVSRTSGGGGVGDVVGPASATDNAVARFDGTTGKLIQNSAVTIADTTGDITGGKYNNVTITPPVSAATLTLGSGKTVQINNTLSFSGTDSTTMTFPSTSTTVAGLGIAQTFTQDQTISGNLTLNAQGDVRFADADSSNWVAFQAASTIASNVTWTLPNADGTNGQFLSTNGSGTLSWAGSDVVVQTDIGTAANEIPLNQYLGANAYVDTETPALNIGTGITTGTGTICKANGGLSGGIYRMTILIDLTGLNSGGTAGDIIGVNGTALPCYIAQLPAMTVLGGRMTCLETPAGGDTDIDLYSATEGTGVEDQAITALTETQIINAGTQSIGTVTYFAADPATNAYFYLVGQSTSNATYTAGRFLIEIFGVQ